MITRKKPTHWIEEKNWSKRKYAIIAAKIGSTEVNIEALVAPILCIPAKKKAQAPILNVPLITIAAQPKFV